MESGCKWGWKRENCNAAAQDKFKAVSQDNRLQWLKCCSRLNFSWQNSNRFQASQLNLQQGLGNTAFLRGCWILCAPHPPSSCSLRDVTSVWSWKHPIAPCLNNWLQLWCTPLWGQLVLGWSVQMNATDMRLVQEKFVKNWLKIRVILILTMIWGLFFQNRWHRTRSH